MRTEAEVEEGMQVLDPSLEARVQVFPVDVFDGARPGHILSEQRRSTVSVSRRGKLGDSMRQRGRSTP